MCHKLKYLFSWNHVCDSVPHRHLTVVQSAERREKVSHSAGGKNCFIKWALSKLNLSLTLESCSKDSSSNLDTKILARHSRGQLDERKETDSDREALLSWWRRGKVRRWLLGETWKRTMTDVWVASFFFLIWQLGEEIPRNVCLELRFKSKLFAFCRQFRDISRWSFTLWFVCSNFHSLI